MPGRGGVVCLRCRPGPDQPLLRPKLHLDLIVPGPVCRRQIKEVHAGVSRRLGRQELPVRELPGHNHRGGLGQQLGVVFYKPEPRPQGQHQQNPQAGLGQPPPPAQLPPRLAQQQTQGVPQQLLSGLLPPLSRQQLGHRQPQAVPQGLQQGQVRKIQATLPLAHRLSGHVEGLGELLLGQPCGPVFPYFYPYGPKLAFINASMRAALSCFMRSVKWPYRSNVNPALACPRLPWMVLISSPARIALTA